MDFNDIYYKYANEGYELKDILKIWKDERLNPEKIKRQLSQDIGIKISSGDAKQLYKIARDNNFPMPKIAEVNVSWELGEREAEDGTKKFYIIRKEKQPTKTASTIVLYDHFSATPNNMKLYPVTCPAQKNNIEDYLKDEEGNPVCINTQFCKYFQEAIFSEINHEKDITCQISNQEK
jgi:hypothetical protein